MGCGKDTTSQVGLSSPCAASLAIFRTDRYIDVRGFGVEERRNSSAMFCHRSGIGGRLGPFGNKLIWRLCLYACIGCVGKIGTEEVEEESAWRSKMSRSCIAVLDSPT